MSHSTTLVVGIGSPHGDDQAGWIIADRLAVAADAARFQVRKAKSPSELLDWLDGVDRLIVCDACRGLGAAGQVRSWQWPDVSLSAPMWSGTHDLSLPAALQLAERLGRLPDTVVVWSVEAANANTLSPLSPQVDAALVDLTRQLIVDATSVTYHA